MNIDDKVVALFKKYLHFNSQEDADEFHRDFFEWLNTFSGDMVNIGLKNGFSAGIEACANSLRKLDEENVEKLLKESDVVVDCVDRIGVRKIVGRACKKLGIPLIEGGIHGFYGYILPINPGQSACLECMETGETKEVLPVPALGAVAGVIGSLQAVECLKVLLGLSVSYGTMLSYDGIYGEFDPVPVPVRKDCTCQMQEENL